MDETIRIYVPTVNALGKHMRPEDKTEEKEETKIEPTETLVKPEPPVQKKPWRKQTYLETLQEVLKERSKQESYMNFRHPWFNLAYNWMIAVLIVAMFASFCWWGAKIRKDYREESIRATAYAEYEAAAQAEKQAEEEAKAKALAEEKASEEYIVNELTTSLSKMYYGVKNFQEKYRYSDTDFETYGRCAWNRMLNPAYSDDFAEVVFQPDQFLNCSENNPDVEPYHSMAKKHIQKWRAETVAPVSNDYVYAELTPNGVYLRNEFKADGYARRWRAEG